MEAASGYVILSHLQDDQRQRVIDEWIRETGKKVPRDLDVHLARIRKAGFEKRASYLVKGIVNISYPIFDDRGSALGALTVPYIQYNGAETSSATVVAALRKATTEITTALGGKLPNPKADKATT